MKFLGHGQGSGARASAYLTGELDHKGETRAGVEVLRGNPAMLGELIDSLPFVERYTSGVLAWHLDDEPIDEQIEQALDEFEALGFAGLPPECRAWAAVRHIEADGSTHVHVVIARVDLGTGRSFNPAPPGWEPGYNLLRDALNACFGWASPDAIEHRRVVKRAERRHADDPEADPREWLTSALEIEVEQGRVTDHAGVVTWLAGKGEITRTGRDYVSVKPEGQPKAIRLKGALYAEGFSREAFISAKRSRAAAKRPEPDPLAERRARRGLAKIIERRTAYNVQRYCTPGVRERKRLERAQALAAAHTAIPQAAAAAVPEFQEAPHDSNRATAREEARRDVEAAPGGDSSVDWCCRAVERAIDFINETAARARRNLEIAKQALERSFEALRGADEVARLHLAELKRRAADAEAAEEQQLAYEDEEEQQDLYPRPS